MPAVVFKTIKPTAMLEGALFDISNRGDIVINPFLGSGSTLVAAHRTGRVCYGIELDPRYVDLIINRFEQVTGIEAKLTNHSVSYMANAQKTRVLIKRVPTNYETIHQFVARNILENGRYYGALNFCGNNELSLRAKSVRSRIQTLRRRSAMVFATG